MNSSDFRHYLKWRLDRYTRFVYKWTAALKAVKPGFVAAPWTTGPGRWWHWMGAPAAEGTDAVHRVLDAPFLELFWDFPPDQGSNLLPAFTCRYYRGLTGDRPAWILPYLCEQGQFNMQPPRAECDLREMTVLTNGCLVAQGYWQQNEETPACAFQQAGRGARAVHPGIEIAQVGRHAGWREQPAALRTLGRSHRGAPGRVDRQRRGYARPGQARPRRAADARAHGVGRRRLPRA